MWEALFGVLAGFLVLLVVLWRTKPEEAGLRDALRLLPDLIRLLRRLAADPALPRGIRVRLVLLLGYLALPIDLIPDFIPVLGYADDAIVVALGLRSVVRRAGPDALASIDPALPRAYAPCIDSRCFRPHPDQRTRGDDPGAVIAAQWAAPVLLLDLLPPSSRFRRMCKGLVDDSPHSRMPPWVRVTCGRRDVRRPPRPPGRPARPRMLW